MTGGNFWIIPASARGGTTQPSSPQYATLESGHWGDDGWVVRWTIQVQE